MLLCVNAAAASTDLSASCAADKDCGGGEEMFAAAVTAAAASTEASEAAAVLLHAAVANWEDHAAWLLACPEAVAVAWWWPLLRGRGRRGTQVRT